MRLLLNRFSPRLLIHRTMSTSPNAVPSVKLASGHSMPLLGFGTWGGGDTPDKVADAVSVALSSGYTHIDCAQFYLNEKQIGERIGQYIQQQSLHTPPPTVPTGDHLSHRIPPPSSHARSQLFITSKLWNTNHSPANVRGSVLQTLNDLQCAYLDLLLIHWPEAWRFTGYDFSQGGGTPIDETTGQVAWQRTPIIDTWRAMEALVDEGYVRSIGVSNFTVPLLHDLRQQNRLPISVNQVELHPYLTQNGLVEYCQYYNIHCSAYSPLGRPGRTAHESVIHDETIKTIADRYTSSGTAASPASILIAWAIRRGTSALPKSSTPARVQSNYNESLALVNILSDDDIKLITNLNQNLRYVNTSFATSAGKFQRGGVSLFE